MKAVEPVPKADWGRRRERSVQWYDPSILTAAGAALSGRETLEAVAGGRLPEPPMARLIGARLASVGEGEVVFAWTADEATYNPIGIVHGGLLCTLLDFAAGAAVQTLLPAGAVSSSIEIKVSYLRAVRAESGTIQAHGQVLRVGRRVAFSEAHARNENGELVGHATTSLAVTRGGD